MRKPLFVQQPFCRERQHCVACRQSDPVYREQWAQRYTMPAGWPDCPYGLPFGYMTPPPRPSDPQLQTAYDLPDSPEAVRIRQALRDRSQAHSPVCSACPHHRGSRTMPDGRVTVECQIGKRCCGGVLEPGTVELGTGACPEGRW